MSSARRRVGVPGELPASQYVLIFCVPLFAIVVLFAVVFVNGRVESQRDEARADAEVEQFMIAKLASTGPGSVSADPEVAWICDIVRLRAEGKPTAVEPYDKMSRGLAVRFVRELCAPPS